MTPLHEAFFCAQKKRRPNRLSRCGEVVDRPIGLVLERFNLNVAILYLLKEVDDMFLQV